MTLSRREFMVASSLAVVAGSVRGVTLGAQQPAAAPAAPPVVPTFTPIRRNVGIFTARGGTIGWLVASDGVAVVDSQFPDTAQMFLDGLKQRSGRRIDLLINTHHHGDHTGGNLTLRPSVTRILGHANQPGLQRKQAAAAKSDAAQAYADETFSESWRGELGGETIDARYYGAGHTNGDIAITFERANVVHMGDLMFNHRHPRVDRPGGASIRNWITVLERVTNDHDADTVYIFGHSKVGLPLTGTRADLLAFRDYFSGLLAFVQKEIAAGKSAEEVSKSPQVPGFPDHEGVPAGTLQMAYEELTAKA
jgi:glyoxylase-like metal-dependent hydrolase (beta-lactamase superfamily II)